MSVFALGENIYFYQEQILFANSAKELYQLGTRMNNDRFIFMRRGAGQYFFAQLYFTRALLLHLTPIPRD